MKYVLIVGDGMSDRPVFELGGRTPLMMAAKPNMERLAREGRVGLVRTCPAGFPVGTEIGTMTLMGYEPARYFSGRGPLEALGRGIELRKSEVAWRCNLVTVKGEVIEDYSAGHITDPEAKQLIQMLDKRLGGEEIRFHPGVSYRHLMVWRGGADDVKTTAPHDIVGVPWRPHVPKGRGEARLLSLMEDSRVLLDGHEVNRARRAKGLKSANMIWLWSPGKTPAAPGLKEKYGVTGAVISAVDVVRGIGVMAGLEVIRVPGATGYFDTNYKGKGEAAAKALKTHDFVFVHVEAPDEAGHQGLASEKIKAIEAIDREIVGNLLRVAPKLGEMAILVAPDHATPLEVRSHTDDPVPYILWHSAPKPPTALANGELRSPPAPARLASANPLTDLPRDLDSPPAPTSAAELPRLANGKPCLPPAPGPALAVGELRSPPVSESALANGNPSLPPVLTPPPPESVYDEASVRSGPGVIEEGWKLLDRLFGRAV